MALKRIERELLKFQQDPPGGCSVQLRDDDRFKWLVIVKGPEGTPYEGGDFCFHVDFCEQYPFKPPRIRMKTKIFHSGWSLEGNECIHETSSAGWAPSLSVAKIFMIYLSMLTEPTTDLGLRPDIDRLYRTDRVEHDRVALAWARMYAGAPGATHLFVRRVDVVGEGGGIEIVVTATTLGGSAVEVRTATGTTWMQLVAQVWSEQRFAAQMHHPSGDKICLSKSVVNAAAEGLPASAEAIMQCALYLLQRDWDAERQCCNGSSCAEALRSGLASDGTLINVAEVPGWAKLESVDNADVNTIFEALVGLIAWRAGEAALVRPTDQCRDEACSGVA